MMASQTSEQIPVNQPSRSNGWPSLRIAAFVALFGPVWNPHTDIMPVIIFFRVIYENLKKGMFAGLPIYFIYYGFFYSFAFGFIYTVLRLLEKTVRKLKKNQSESLKS